ncbi:hypothetical protein [Deinococcus aquaticus]|uniref:hypothetical protein n=1 Tax=Deinococcus aquaticus TaxID=328692 RepID=UPI003F4836AB
MPKLHSMLVSENLRSYFYDRYPLLFEHEHSRRYLRLMLELMFPSWTDPSNKWVVLTRERLAQIEEREADLRGGRYSGKELLQSAQEMGLQLEIQEASHLQGRARTVRVHWAPGLMDLLRREMLLLPGERTKEPQLEFVDFITGKRAPKSAPATIRRAVRREREQVSGAAELQMLNRVSPQTHQKFEGNMGEAQEVANSIDREGRRLSNLTTLFALNQRGLAPTYTTSLHSPRYYAEGISMAQLSENVRKTLLGGAWSLDLVAAQLAILARQWELRGWQRVLQDAPAGGVWTQVLRDVKLGGLEHKAAFKTLLYSAAYGMSKANLQARAAEAFGPGQADVLFGTELMRELLAGRRERQAQLQRDGGLLNQNGDMLVSLQERAASLKAAKRTASPISSLLAHEAQAIELDLMRPVLDRMRTDGRFRIVLWLHDGCYVTTGYPEALEQKLIEQVVREVNGRAAQAEVATTLTSMKLL